MTDDAPPPLAAFGYEPARDGEPALVRAAGDIDLRNVGQFQDALDQAIRDRAAAGAVTADMTEVTYCDSAAIRALFAAARRSRLAIRIRKAGAVSEVLLRVSGLDQVATVVIVD
ncbi:MAG TPA: STAS domain-containing protein [Trebonia sp.]|jgi:anti-anti-sigma factor|nr:STAS domain-containing protein [Trebonia sp.]